MNTNTSKRVSNLNVGDVFINSATRHEVVGIRTAEMSHPTNQRYMLVTTPNGSLKIPASTLVKIV